MWQLPGRPGMTQEGELLLLVRSVGWANAPTLHVHDVSTVHSVSIIHVVFIVYTLGVQ